MVVHIDEGALRRLLAGHDEQLAICDTLEQIADGLPHDVDSALCHRTAERLHAVMQEATANERAILGATLVEIGTVRHLDVSRTARRLLRESDEDLSHAEELQDALSTIGTDRPTVCTDALGYMLRGFFEARKRRIALEREVVMALLGTTAH
ncbi:hemerythrin domain-containing protein [Devosia aquimaris]|uniref:hemerythrin domain-containing protein n=1 Tax=Devosia aquimaris TaxID=2866214 RepID=UPI001CD16DCD|nr:hemerythrin domain-containing protein [Devosia sp. CJK-A8-3]